MEKQDLDKLPQLLDYLLGLDAPEKRRQTESLIAEDEDIGRLYDSLRQNLEPLELWQDVNAPEGLTEKTLNFINEQEKIRRWAEESTNLIARRAQQTYSKAATSYGTQVRWVLNNLRDLIAAAACLILVFSLFHPSFQQARRRAQQLACASQLGRIGYASNNYALDNNGILPHLPRKPGATWWSVGQQGAQNVSNTRDAYLLIKLGYLRPQEFLCPEVDNKTIHFRLEIDPQLLQNLQDFRSREYVNYSFRLLISSRPLTLDNINSALPIASDQNPIFARFDSGTRTELDLSQDKLLLMSNSPNHASRGQNLLFPDGSVRFITDRLYQSGPDRDDIFTIRAVFRYRGTELPKSDRDIFIH